MFGFYADLGIIGLWVGLDIGYVIITIVVMIFVFRSNWDKIIEKAVELQKIES